MTTEKLKLKDVVATVARNEVELCIDLVNRVIMKEFDRIIAPKVSIRRIDATLFAQIRVVN